MGLLRYAPLLLCALAQLAGRGQCPSTISTFPYQEGFEGGAAWTSGGTGDDWAWGTPAHPTINSAGGGAKCWSVGGLTGSFYNLSEQSWLEGPCFDFTTLQFPMVSFKAFWECERTYDGAGFQYSLDQGATWNNVGGYNDPPECVDSNWFNTGNILNLGLATPKAGWSGRIGATSGSCAGGFGSGGWVTASHCLAQLAGEPSVKFRFIFGAGSTCNNFDGFAVDDIRIGEAPPEQTSFQSECFGSEVSVHDISSCATSWTWDFGEPASGAANTSVAPTAEHTYAAPGTYTITLSLVYSCRPPQQMQLVVNTLGVDVDVTDPTCAGNDGAVDVSVTNAAGPLTYTWSPGGETTEDLNGLGAGTYVLNVNDGGICPAAAMVTLAPPPAAPSASLGASTDATCNGTADGSASVNVSGGTPAYTYAWAPQGGSGASATDLPAGTYTCTITDASNCATSVQVVIQEPDVLSVSAQADATICVGESVELTATGAGGTQPYVFTWSPSGPSVSPQSTTTYTVDVTDANGCNAASDAVDVIVGSVSAPEFTIADSMGCFPHCAAFTAAEVPNVTYAWDFGDGAMGEGGPAITHCYDLAGTHDVTLTITSGDGCDGTWTLDDAVDVLPTPDARFFATPPIATIEHATIHFLDASAGGEGWSWSFGDPTDSTSTERSPRFTYLEVGCYEVWLRVSTDAGCTDSTSYLLCIEDEFAVFVPNAFTPNEDGFNDALGIITSVGDPRDFELDVFDRWGGVLFHADAKDRFWDGTVGGAQLPIGVYHWRLRMRDSEGLFQERQGHVTLVR